MKATAETPIHRNEPSMLEAQTPVELFLALKNSVSPAFAVVAGVELDVFSTLEGKAQTVDEIAAALEVEVPKLRALLYVLVDAGIVRVDAGRFANSAVAEALLVRGSPRYAGDAIRTLPSWWQPLWRTADSVRSGLACAKIDYSTASSEALEEHYRTFYELSLATGRGLAARYDFSACRQLLDVGGGTGGVSIAIAEQNPQLRATIVDFPNVLPTCQRFVDASACTTRVTVAAADATRDPLGGPYDVAVMSAFMPVLGATSIRAALRNVVQCLDPGATLYVTDAGMLDDSRLSPAVALHNNLNFINYFDEGEAHTVGERRQWLAQAGFELHEVDVLPNQWGVLVARKPPARGTSEVRIGSSAHEGQ